MGPDWEKRIITVSRGELSEKIDFESTRKYLDKETPANSLFPKVKLGDIAELKRGPFGGAVKKEIFVPKTEETYQVYEQYNAINNDPYRARYHITPKDYLRLQGFSVQAGDILMSCSGTIGKLVAIPNDFEKGIINQALLRIRIREGINQDYFRIIFSDIITILTSGNELSYGSAIKNIASVGELKNIEIPLPPLDIQNQIVEMMDRAIETKNRLEREADEMLAGVDDWLLGELGIEKGEKSEKKVFMVNIGKTFGNPLSAEFYIEKGSSDYISKSIKDLADINPSRSISIDKNGVVPYVGLPETSDGIVNEVNIRPFKEVGARNTIQKGDILFARIEPSIFNKKYILVDDLKGHDFALTSTEFYVLESRKDIVSNQYLYYLLFSNPVYSQFAGKTTGSTGRRRLDRQVFENIQIPLPPLSEQEHIAEHISSIIETARAKREEAKWVYEEAREKVEGMILGD